MKHKKEMPQPTKLHEAYEMMHESIVENPGRSDKFEYREMQRAMEDVMFPGRRDFSYE